LPEKRLRGGIRETRKNIERRKMGHRWVGVGEEQRTQRRGTIYLIGLENIQEF